MESLAISNGPRFVRKRDNKTTQKFDLRKIENAIRAAWEAVRPGRVADTEIRNIAIAVCEKLSSEETADVDRIQTEVGYALMDIDKEVAEAFIEYRTRRSALRETRKTPDAKALADYIHAAKYARYIPELSRRELYDETVDRVRVMHLKKFPQVKSEINWAFDRVQEKRVFPSMRAMQFGGEAIEKVNCRSYNCSFTHINRPKVFSEVLYLLLCGSGVGFSVQRHHVEMLPKLAVIDEKKPETFRVIHHHIDDSIEGWADALDALINAHIQGHYVEFDYSQIRPAGAPLKTSGGRAPGHLGLREAIELIRKILRGAGGRKLTPIECYDILCHAADAVLSGGIRRSAMIALFSLDDEEMLAAKASADWYDKYPWRANSNNSVVILRGSVTRDIFHKIIQATKQWGEPGFVFLDSLEYGVNPCSEIGLDPTVRIDALNIEKFVAAGFNVQVGDKLSGVAFCNLTETNAAKFRTYEDFEIAAKAAVIIGTLQAAYTDFKYLGLTSEEIAKRDALLGVSMTGMLDAPDIACNPEYQKKIAGLAIEWNREIAEKLGINPAARITSVKPAGTTSLAFGGTASGHHAHHARRYIRRVTANAMEPVFQYFKMHNEHMCVRKPNGDYVIEFVIEAPSGAIVKDDLSAIEFLDMVKSTQTNWVAPGTARPDVSPGLTHNVSNTIHVHEQEWEQVADYLYDNQQYFTGVSLLPATADKAYSFSPNEAITTEADENRWNQIVDSYKPIDYQLMVETEDGTALKAEAACANGACERV